MHVGHFSISPSWMEHPCLGAGQKKIPPLWATIFPTFSLNRVTDSSYLWNGSNSGITEFGVSFLSCSGKSSWSLWSPSWRHFKLSGSHLVGSVQGLTILLLGFSCRLDKAGEVKRTLPAPAPILPRHSPCLEPSAHTWVFIFTHSHIVVTAACLFSHCCPAVESPVWLFRLWIPPFPPNWVLNSFWVSIQSAWKLL